MSGEGLERLQGYLWRSLCGQGVLGWNHTHTSHQLILVTSKWALDDSFQTRNSLQADEDW